MKYVSTRDSSAAPTTYDFLDAVLEGLAPDGGLLVPESIPSVSPVELDQWRSLNYQELCFLVIRKFVDSSEISDDELLAMITTAYSSFSAVDVVPLVPVGAVQVMELFHGPTFAFKDVALQLLGHLFDVALRRRGARMTILGATSGDTGSAAIAGVKGRSNIDCVILFPLGKTSHVQELQMTANLDSNIFCVAVKDSVFDDCQSIVKACFGDAEFNAEMALGAVNSINWARILAQVVYYAYASIRAPINTRTSFIVPTGNFGNILAGYYAKKMGFPIDKLVIASNTNDILPRFFETGIYHVKPVVVPTMSPSMDIGVSSNFERFLFDLFGRDAKITAEKFALLKTEKKFSVTPEQLREAREHFLSYAVDEAHTLETIAATYAEHQYLLCPHSAVGYNAALQFKKEFPESSAVALATAHIGKFTENILSNLTKGSDAEWRAAVAASVPEELRKLASVKTRRFDIENSVDAVKQFLTSHVLRK